jgi:hypothetical protein
MSGAFLSDVPPRLFDFRFSNFLLVPGFLALVLSAFVLASFDYGAEPVVSLRFPPKSRS